MRAPSASSSASGATGTVNGRIAAAPAEFSVVADMYGSLSTGLAVDAEQAVVDEAGALWAGQEGRRSATPGAANRLMATPLDRTWAAGPSPGP